MATKLNLEKHYLLEKRKQIIFKLLMEDFTKADVARIFNVDKSMITVMMKKFGKEYKEFVEKNKYKG